VECMPRRPIISPEQTRTHSRQAIYAAFMIGTTRSRPETTAHLFAEYPPMFNVAEIGALAGIHQSKKPILAGNRRRSFATPSNPTASRMMPVSAF